MYLLSGVQCELLNEVNDNIEKNLRSNEIRELIYNSGESDQFKYDETIK